MTPRHIRASLSDAPARGTRPPLLDLILPASLVVGTVAYLATLPPNLSAGDESSYLHEAERLLRGEVMYRDVFDFITPGFQYLMALLFGVFGTTMTTARIGAGVIHGLIAVALYGACRRVGVRPLLAAAAGLVHLTADQSAWPIASQHWLSTLMCTGLVWAWARGVETERDAARGALFLGLLVIVQQQRAVPMVAGAAVWLVIDPLVMRAFGTPADARALSIRLAVFAATIAVVAMPVIGWCVARAGFADVWRALVEFPFRSYGANTHCAWGHVNVMSYWYGTFTFPRVLAWLPLSLAATTARVAALVVRRRDEAHARRLVWLLVFALASMSSILYFPDFIHIAFIAPAFYVVIAENVESATRRLGRRAGRLATAVVVGGTVIVSGFQLSRNASRLWAEFPYRAETRFGRVQFRTAAELRLYEDVRNLVDATPGVELFVYPEFCHLYLMTGARNPTRYTWYASTFGFPDMIAAADAHRTPYAILFHDPGANDRTVQWLVRTYEPATPGGPMVGTILRRRPGT